MRFHVVVSYALSLRRGMFRLQNITRLRKQNKRDDEGAAPAPLLAQTRAISGNHIVAKDLLHQPMLISHAMMGNNAHMCILFFLIKGQPPLPDLFADSTP